MLGGRAGPLLPSVFAIVHASERWSGRHGWWEGDVGYIINVGVLAIYVNPIYRGIDWSMWTSERGWDLTGYIDWSVCVENYERPSYIHTYIEEHRSLHMHAWEIKNARYDGERDVCGCVPSWETDLKKKIACVRWIMPTGSVCACMHERKLVVQL